jgi:hypothetical protein
MRYTGSSRLNFCGSGRKQQKLGHKDARLTLSVYTKAVERRAKLHGAYLAEFERALAWAALPTTATALTGTGAHRDQEAIPAATP